VDGDGDAIERPDFLAELRAQGIGHAPGARRRLAVEALDPLRRVAERFHGRGADGPLRRIELGRRHRELRGGERHAIVALGEV
jgi:hypothetical protein